MNSPDGGDGGVVRSDMPPSMQQNVTILKAVVIGLGVLIVAAVLVLVFTLISRMNARPPAAGFSTQITLPAGAQVLESHWDQGKLTLRMNQAGQEFIRQYDPATGAELSSLVLKPGIRPPDTAP